MNTDNLFRQFLEIWRPRINNALDEFIGHNTSISQLERFFGSPVYEYDLEIIQKSLWDPLWDFMDRGGKRWRPALLILSAAVLGNVSESTLIKKILPLSIIPEIIHNGTIIVDDVEDNSKTRRKKPSLHLLFGIDTAVNCGNWLYFLPMFVLYEFHKQKTISRDTFVKAYEIYQEEMLNLHLGQASDIGWHRSSSAIPSEAQYLQMCLNKTGCLARMAARLGVILGGGNTEQCNAIGHYAGTIGVAFQIQDDILNLRPPDTARWTKDIGEDITEGKRTLMILHLLTQISESQQQKILDILNQHTENKEVIQEIISQMTTYGSFEYAENIATDLVQSAWNQLTPLLHSSSFKETLKAFGEYVIDRPI
ncbi:MAG: polyprenyl synthetase family protein [Promethearchaeota archaeon]